MIIGGVNSEGVAINGRMDQLMYGKRRIGETDRNAFTIVDYKTHYNGQITPDDIYQAARYQDMFKQIQDYALVLQKEGKSFEQISEIIVKQLPSLLKGYDSETIAQIQSHWSPELISKLITRDEKGFLPAIMSSVAVGNT
jgi:hypothetical protein